MPLSKPSWNPLRRDYIRDIRDEPRRHGEHGVVTKFLRALRVSVARINKIGVRIGISITEYLGLDDHLDGSVHLVFEVPDRGRQLVERKRVRMERRRIELLLRNERRGATDCALPFAADAVEIDVVGHDVTDVD